MAVKSYQEEGKTLWAVHAKDRNMFGKQINRKKKGISSKARAERLYIQFRMELQKLKTAPALLNWEEWFAECLRKMKLEFRPSTVINYDKLLGKWATPHLKGRRIDTIRKSEIHTIIFQRVHGVSDESRRTILKQVKRIFNMAVDEGLITASPAAGLKVKVAQKKKLCLNSEEIKSLLSFAYQKNHPFYEIWAVALMTGMRSGELHALLWTDVDFENNYISVNKSWSSKNGTGPTKNTYTRSVPMSSELKKLLLKMKVSSKGLNVLPRRSEWDQGKQASIIGEVCKELKITVITFHDLRATFITQMLIKDVPLAKVMKIVGHSTIKTTMIYLRMIAKDVEGATEALGIELPDYIGNNNVVSLF